MSSTISAEILGKFYCSNVGALLVEDIPDERYLEIIREINEQITNCDKPLSRDFLEMLLENKMQVYENLRKTQNHFVYNFDLFGEGVDPKKATDIMNCMRSAKNTGDSTRQLMIARPLANLDYNSRKGFGYHDNHPLGNWCEFYRVEGDKLVSQMNPNKHR